MPLQRVNSIRIHLTAAAVAAAAASFFAATASADAVVRYASPAGATAGDCTTTGTACRLDHAVSVASPGGDTVQLLGGSDYVVTYPITATGAVTITAGGGVARPRIVSDALRSKAIIDMQYGGAISNVYVESSSPYPAIAAKSATIDNVIAHSAVGGAIEVAAGTGSLVRNTVASSADAFAAAVALEGSSSGGEGEEGEDGGSTPGPVRIVNVTAVATGTGSTGIENGAGGAVTMVNTIASGSASDIAVADGAPNATVSHSAFRPLASTGVTDGGSNITGAVFADSDYHQDRKSPTIDAGTASATGFGGADPDGRQRTIGAAPDIGAYERPAATAGTDPGTNPGRNPSGGDSTGSGGGDGTAGKSGVLPPRVPPVLGRSVGLGTAEGAVTVRLPGSSERIPLGDGASVPVGSVVDARRGVVELTSVRDDSGETQTGQFWGGKFKVRQSEKGKQFTVLKLVGRIRSCRAGENVSASKRRRGRRVRRLWGRDHRGRFRTRGRRGQATVRGTKWLTEDRCSGTYFRVKRGRVTVRDFGKRKRVTLKRGKSYLARAR